MSSKLAFVISFFLHALVVLSVYLPMRTEQSQIQIEVRFQKSQNSPTQKITSQSNPSTQTSEASESQQQSSAVLGSDVGIQALYPRLSRVMGESGTVLIAIEDQKVRVFESSGHARLDDSAIAATQDAVKSGLLSSGKNLQIRFVFKLME